MAYDDGSRAVWECSHCGALTKEHRGNRSPICGRPGCLSASFTGFKKLFEYPKIDKKVINEKK